MISTSQLTGSGSGTHFCSDASAAKELDQRD
jgi:hypothetical protein